MRRTGALQAFFQSVQKRGGNVKIPLAFSEPLCYDIKVVKRQAPLAQLDRASGYGPEGRGFESLTAYQKSSKSSDFEDFCFS